MEDLNLRTVFTTIKVLAGLRIQPLCQPPNKQDTNGGLEPPNIVFFQYIVLSIYRFAVCVFIARTGKLEFPTSALTAQRSNQLNYARE